MKFTMFFIYMTLNVLMLDFSYCMHISLEGRNNTTVHYLVYIYDNDMNLLIFITQDDDITVHFSGMKWETILSDLAVG